MNPYNQNTLRGWFVDVGYLYILVAALVTVGFLFKSLDFRALSVTSDLHNPDYDGDIVDTP